MKQVSDKKRLSLNTLVMLSSAVLDRGMFFIINIIVARYLSVEHFGEYTTALAFATFFSTFSDIGVNQTLKRAVNLDSRFRHEHFTNTLIIKTFLSVIIYGLLAVSLNFTGYNRDTVNLTLLFGLVRIGNEYMSAFYALHEAHEKFFIVSLIRNSFSITFLFSTVLVVLSGADYFFFAYARLIVVASFTGLIAWVTLKSAQIRFNASTLKDFLYHAFFFGLSRILSNLYLRTNILILSFIQGTLYTGIFRNGHLFYSTIAFIPVNFGKVLIPYLYKKDHGESPHTFQFAFNVYTKVLAIISFYLFMLFNFYADSIITLVFGVRYSDSAPVLRIISFAIPFMFNVSATMITALDLQKFRTRMQGLALAINIAANIVLAYYFSAVGTAMATVITSASLFFMYNSFLNRRGYIKHRVMAWTYLALATAVSMLYMLRISVLSRIADHWSIMITTLLYCSWVWAVLIRRGDMDIAAEIFRKKTG